MITVKSLSNVLIKTFAAWTLKSSGELCVLGERRRQDDFLRSSPPYRDHPWGRQYCGLSTPNRLPKSAFAGGRFTYLCCDLTADENLRFYARMYNIPNLELQVTKSWRW
jgi:hypothetical protein